MAGARICKAGATLSTLLPEIKAVSMKTHLGGERSASSLGCYTHGKEPPGHIQYEPELAPQLSGCFGNQKNILLLPGFEPRFLSCATRSLVTTPTELPRIQTSSGHGNTALKKICNFLLNEYIC